MYWGLTVTIHSKEVVNANVGWPMKSAAPAPLRYPSLYRRFGKRFLDICFVVLSAPIVVPLTLVFALMLVSQGVMPFYRQPRVGRNGKIFNLLKLRTMVHDAEAVLDRYLSDNPEARDEWERNQKLQQDPRIIKGGAFLRKSSMDELPQFWNVLMGEMSLIGPRPMMVSQQELYPSDTYYSMRPGISGMWQVSKRNNSTFADRALHDNAYWKCMSFSTDVSILVRTIFVVLRGTGC